MKVITVDADAHAQLVLALQWIQGRPPMLQLERYELDDSKNKMIGFLIDHMYETEIQEEASDGGSDYFTGFFFDQYGDLCVTDWDQEDYVIKPKEQENAG